ncbi:hypothetical protein G127AT_12645 [Agromyces archimandritae]|uniref:DUF3137 domain-containing protein n=1 Tax=Agromyces archimandritae TaxID=2781962 RepID=A0A975FQK9_9MICO|nr:hypothetical protein G127AT_12645 [Agromyces archimandritae]
MFPNLDTRPLTEPVDAAVLARGIREGADAGPRSRSGNALVVIVVVAAAALVVLPAVGGFVTAFARSGSTGAGLEFGSLLGPLIALGVGAVGAVLWRAEQRRRRIRRYRLGRFAAANGMAYVPFVQAPGLPGMIFGRGSSRGSHDVIRSAHAGRFTEFANYRYTTGSGKNKRTHSWGYVAIHLGVPLPNIVLDAVGNDFFGSNLPTGFGRDQRLGLEGDFDRHFALYCPRGYERDALYLFTPDVMARFIDHAADLDVEIVDDWMLLYTQREISTLDPAMWRWISGTVSALTQKIERWERWRDERLRSSGAAAAAADSEAPAVRGVAAVPGAGAAPGADAAAPADPQGAAGHPLAAAATAAGPSSQPATVAPPLAPPPGVARGGRRLRPGVKWVPILLVAGFILLWMLPHFGAAIGMFFLR